MKKFFLKSKSLKSSEELQDKLIQSKLMLTRLNNNTEIEIPKVNSLLKKYHDNLNDEIISIFESLLLIFNKLEDQNCYEFNSWIKIQAESCERQVFSIFDYLDHEDCLIIEKLLFNFYCLKKSNKKLNT